MVYVGVRLGMARSGWVWQDKEPQTMSKRIRITVAEVDAARRDIIEQGHERLSRPRVTKSHAPAAPVSMRKGEAPTPKPAKRVTPRR